MGFDERDRFGVHERIDDIGQCAVDQFGDLLLLPPSGNLERRFAHLHHAAFVGTEVAEHDLTPQRPNDQPAVEHPLLVQAGTERQHRRFGDDGLVEIEEGGLGHVGIVEGRA